MPALHFFFLFGARVAAWQWQRPQVQATANICISRINSPAAGANPQHPYKIHNAQGPTPINSVKLNGAISGVAHSVSHKYNRRPNPFMQQRRRGHI